MTKKITELTESTSPSITDVLEFTLDPGGTPLSRKLQLQNLLKIVNGLTEDTSPDSAADFLLSYDASASSPKKVKPSSLSIAESKITFTDITTGNASASAHGYLPKLSGSVTDVLKGDGTFGAISAGATAVRKSADETVNNSTVLQNDDHLLISAAANKAYQFVLYLIVNMAASSGADDMKIGWSYPVGCTAFWGIPGVLNTSAEGLAASGTASTPLTNQGITATPAYATGNGLTFLIQFAGIFINGANAGNINFQWAQNAAGARDLKLLTNSVLIYTLLN